MAYDHGAYDPDPDHWTLPLAVSLRVHPHVHILLLVCVSSFASCLISGLVVAPYVRSDAHRQDMSYASRPFLMLAGHESSHAISYVRRTCSCS